VGAAGDRGESRGGGGVSSGARFIVVTASASGEVVRRALVEPGSLVVGRGDDCDLAVADALASRRHIVLHARDGGLVVEDLGSRNGTFVVRTLPATGDATAGAVRERVPAGTTRPLELGAALQIGGALVAIFPAGALALDEPVDPAVLSPAMRLACDRLDKVAASELSVLMLGETGVGKEVFARRLHARSPRRDGPFLAINCGHTPESLLDSELFGHERGAFTGAIAVKPGLVEAAAGGVFFLDEVGDMPPVLQVKLLRVLQELRVRRLGANLDLPIDVRFVAATNRDLAAEVAAGRFREDLYYRLAGMTIVVPPLRERPEELRALTDQLLRRACARDRAEVPAVSPDVYRHLAGHRWPGNIRELGNVIARGRVLAGTGPIRVDHLSFDVSLDVAPAAPRPAADTARVAECARIQEVLAACAGNQTRAARELGITRRALIVRLERYDLTRPRRPTS
jgi:two-component system, NtrC family, response regulator AtoC